MLLMLGWFTAQICTSATPLQLLLFKALQRPVFFMLESAIPFMENKSREFSDYDKITADHGDNPNYVVLSARKFCVTLLEKPSQSAWYSWVLNLYMKRLPKYWVLGDIMNCTIGSININVNPTFMVGSSQVFDDIVMFPLSTECMDALSAYCLFCNQ